MILLVLLSWVSGFGMIVLVFLGLFCGCWVCFLLFCCLDLGVLIGLVCLVCVLWCLFYFVGWFVIWVLVFCNVGGLYWFVRFGVCVIGVVLGLLLYLFWVL